MHVKHLTQRHRVILIITPGLLQCRVLSWIAWGHPLPSEVLLFKYS